MEHRTKDEVLGVPPKEDDERIWYLEWLGILTPIGEPHDPCRVVAVPEYVWHRKTLEGALTSSADQSRGEVSPRTFQGRPTAEQPRSPGEFIDSLRRRHFHMRSHYITVGSYFVPQELQQVAERLESSRLTVLTEGAGNSDDNRVEQATWERAARFILRAAKAFWKNHHHSPPAPSISADYEGGIDIVWRHPHRSLYMNVPEEPTSVVTFYGHDQTNADRRLRGEEDIDGDGGWILEWLNR